MSELGFGFLRIPRSEGRYDWPELCRMTDLFLERGGQYFDTCYTYLDGNSEKGILECLVRRHPRDSFLLADKLPGYMCRSKTDAQKYFEESLRRCGVDRFDVYMLHWLNRENLIPAERYDQFGFLSGLKEKGLAERIGFSYHDSASLLDEILDRHPEVDVVQIQLNYLDWDAAGIEAGKCYDVCVRHGKSIIVMEPVKGGTLAAVPEKAEALMRSVRPDWSPSRWALNYAQSLPGVEIVLSGMSSAAQVDENMTGAQDLSEEEVQTLRKAAEIISANTAVRCTGCAYCVSHCPQGIPIPDYFRMYNELQRYPQDGWKIRPVYDSLSRGSAKASSCLKCGECAGHCPQRLPVPELMKAVARAMETGEDQ